MSEEKLIVEETVTQEPVVPEEHDSVSSEPQTNTKSQEEKVPFKFEEEELPSKRLFRSRKEDMNFLRDKWILSRISDNDLMEYLRLEQKRHDQFMEERELRNKRILSAFQLTISLAAVVAIVYLLKDNPTILVNILYIFGLLAGFWLWKKEKDK